MIKIELIKANKKIKINCKMNKINQSEKAITLISLVITIIILLILAGVTLSLTLGENGIITQAQKAKEAGEIAAIKEDFQLAILDKELEKGGTGLTKEELEEIAGNYGELQEDGNTIITEDGYEIKIDEIYKPGGGTSGGGSGASDEELAALEEKIKELEQTVEDLNNTKTELEGTIEDLNKQLEEEQGNNAALQEQIENLQGQVDTLTKTKEELEATISDLNMQIAELQKKQATGNATVADVLEGRTFSNSSNVGLTGTMANRGTLNWAPSNSTSYNIPAGYYSGGTISTANAYNAGNTAGYNNGYNAGINAAKAQIKCDTYTSGPVVIYNNDGGNIQQGTQYAYVDISLGAWAHGTHPTLLIPELTSIGTFSDKSQLTIGDVVVSERYDSQARYRLRLTIISPESQKTWTIASVKLTGVYVYNAI